MAIQYPSNNIHGAPGDRWQNETGLTWWQLKVEFINSCGQCVQYANTLARFWPVPFHPGCNCRSVPVPPGQQAQPFLDFREEIRNLPESQQSLIMGHANYRLVETGVIPWEDVVGRSGIKPLWQVLQKHRLTVNDLTKAGINKHTAQAAWDRVHSPEQLALQQQHKQFYDQLIALGLTPDQIREEMTRRLAARFGLTGKPNTGGSPLVVPKPPPQSPPPAGPAPNPAKPKPKPGPKTGPVVTQNLAPVEPGPTLHPIPTGPELKPPNAVSVRIANSLQITRPGQQDDFRSIFRTEWKVLQDEYEAQGKISRAQQQAVKLYTDEAYDRINSELRAGYTPPEVPLIDAAMRRTTQDIVVYRGMRNFGGRPDDHEDMVGFILDHKNYGSSSIRTIKAEEFAGSSGDVFQIMVPKGTNHIVTKDISKRLQECEIILPRNGNLRITRFIGIINGRRYFEATYVERKQP